MITRRNLLVGAGVAAGASLFARRGRAGLPDDPNFVLAGATAHNVLEIFLYGALSPWESFYFEPTDLTDVYDASLRSQYTTASVTTGTDRCPSVTLPTLPPSIIRGPGDRHFRFTGKTFGFAKGTRPLIARPKILERTRIVTMTHEFNAHPIAIPFAITGRRFGDARGASLGAAVQRRHASDGPVSFVILPPNDRIATDALAFETFFATGMHPASSRPVRLDLGGANELADWAERTGRSDEGDALLRHYRDRYLSRIGGASRSRHAAAYGAVVQGLDFAPGLVDKYRLLPASLGPSVAHCAPGAPSSLSVTNTTRYSLQLAKTLFNGGARYVGMIDAGIGRDTGAAYDGHNNCASVTTGNLYNLLSELMSVLWVPSEGGSRGDRIDLSRTLIVLNTEYGRTLAAQNAIGRNHYGKAYVTALIGGPIAPSADGAPTLAGSFSGMGDTLMGSKQPALLLSAILRAAGIWDEHEHNFAASELDRARILPEVPLRPESP